MTDISIPPKWWGTLKPEESAKIFATGFIDGEPLKRLWKLLKRKDAPPKSVPVFLERESLERVLSGIAKKQ